MHVRVENVTSDGMTSADEDEYLFKKKSGRPRERWAEVRDGTIDRHHARHQLVQEERAQTGRVSCIVAAYLGRG